MSASLTPTPMGADVATSPPAGLSQNGKIQQSHSERSVFASITELDHLREVVRGAAFDFVQLGSGALRGVIARADLGLSAVHVNQLSLPVRAQGDVSAKELTFALLDERNEGVINGERLSADKVLLYQPGGEFDGTATNAYRDWSITVDQAELQRFVFDLSGRDLVLPQPSFACLRPSRDVTERLRAYVLSVLDIAANTPAALEDERGRKALHDELMVRLAALVTDEQRSVPEPRWVGSRSAIVRRAEEFILAHLADGISIADICAVADVSERSLRLAFHQITGVGPNTYLKVRRLHRVRADLEGADPSVTSISMTALQWGFWHFGHFTHDYVHLFGERPSDTLRRPRPRTS
ncbi:MAG: helix-turn-helix domain-containing protein [Tepidisphaeraceae bacterium]